MTTAHLTERQTQTENSELPALGLPDITFDAHVFPNGLRLVVHEDRSAPRVAVQVRYDVGAKDEPAGFTGFAHLFEHLMFKGSANRPGGWHQAVLPLGATNVNGTTSYDRTNFYETVPTAALDRILWMEADRMGFVLDGIDAKSLADEIEVVKNEKRQLSAGPFAATQDYLHEALYPRSHPYGHHVIGDVADLDAATLDTAAYWHSKWYGAANAVIALAGDISFEEAKDKVGHWFGDLPAGEPAQRRQQWLPSSDGMQRLISQARLPCGGMILAWHTCNSRDPDQVFLGLAAPILGAAPRGRLHRRLVEQEKLCVDVSAGFIAQTLCGSMTINVTLAPGAMHSPVEAIIREELDRFIAEGPTAEELDEVRRGHQLGYMGALESIEAKADILSNNALLFGAPDGDRYLRDTAANATPEQVRSAVATWCRPDRQAVHLEVVPFHAQTPVSPNIDRSSPPPMGDVHAPVFPTVHHARLENGLQIRTVQRPSAQRITFRLQLEGGHDNDPVGKEGLTALTQQLLSKQKKHRSVDAFDAELSSYGIQIGMWADGSTAGVSMTCPPPQLTRAMTLAREFLLEPAYTPEEFATYKADMVREQQQERTPGEQAHRAANRLSLGFVRERSPASVESVTLDDVLERYNAWLDSSKAVLFLAGNVLPADVEEAAKAVFGKWVSSTPGNLPAIEGAYHSEPGRYVVAAPGEDQTNFRIRCLDPRLQDLAKGAVVHAYTECLQERLSNKLRGPGWTYGVGCAAHSHPKFGFLQITTAVQADRSIDALRIIEDELRAAADERPITQEEFDRFQTTRILGLVNNWIDNDAVLGAIQRDYTLGLPEGFSADMEARIRATTLGDVQEIATWFSDPSRLVVVALGDEKWVMADGFIPFTGGDGQNN